MITTKDIKAGFRFKTPLEEFIVSHIQDELVYLIKLNDPNSKPFLWMPVEDMVLTFKNNSEFQPLSLTYTETL